MSGFEVGLGLQWLDSTLRNDTTLMALLTGGLYRSLADPSIVPPYGIYAYQGGKNTTTMQGYRVLVDTLYMVKCVGPAALTVTLINAAARIDVLLGGPPGLPRAGAPSGGIVASCYQDSPLMIDEMVNGKVWSNMGGLYRIIIEQSF